MRQLQYIQNILFVDYILTAGLMHDLLTTRDIQSVFVVLLCQKFSYILISSLHVSGNH